MTTETKQKILDYLRKNGSSTAKNIISFLRLSPAAVFRQLKTLIRDQKIFKSGRPPRVFYSIKEEKIVLPSISLEENTEKIIQENFLYLQPDGRILSGVDAFADWCREKNQPFEKTAAEYVQTVKKYDIYKKNGLIDGLQKLRQTFDKVYLDELYYLDFYSIERFGKTKLGTLLLYAKQAQNLNLITTLYELIRERVKRLIIDKKIEAVGFIPPTLNRKIQFQKEIEKLLNLQLPKIKIVKVITDIAIAQKSLTRLEDRIQNARHTIFVDEKNKYKNILLIDDAVGSGATLNETAKKIKDKGLCLGKIIGLTITGSFKGFETINEI